VVEQNETLVEQSTEMVYYRMALEYINLRKLLNAPTIPTIKEAVLEMKRRFPDREKCEPLLYKKTKQRKKNLRPGSILTFGPR
jgi:hypothetical protein